MLLGWSKTKQIGSNLDTLVPSIICKTFNRIHEGVHAPFPFEVIEVELLEYLKGERCLWRIDRGGEKSKGKELEIWGI